MVTPWVGPGTNHQMKNLGIHSWKERIWETRVIQIGIWVKSISNLSISALTQRDQSGPYNLHIRNKCGKIQICGQNWPSSPKGKKSWLDVLAKLQNLDILTQFQNMDFPKLVNGKFRPNAHLHESIRNLNQQKPLPLQVARTPQAPSRLVLDNIYYLCIVLYDRVPPLARTHTICLIGIGSFESRHPLHPSCCFREAEVDWMGRWGTDQVHTGKHASQPASSLSIARAVEKGLQASLRNSLTNCLGFLNSGLNNSFHIQDIQPGFFYYYITLGAIHKWRL